MAVSPPPPPALHASSEGKQTSSRPSDHSRWERGGREAWGGGTMTPATARQYRGHSQTHAPRQSRKLATELRHVRRPLNVRRALLEHGATRLYLLLRHRQLPLRRLWPRWRLRRTRLLLLRRRVAWRQVPHRAVLHRRLRAWRGTRALDEAPTVTVSRSKVK